MLRDLCAVSVLVIKSRSSVATVRYTDNKSSSFTVLSELKCLLLNYKILYLEGADHPGDILLQNHETERKVIPVYCTTYVMQKIWLIRVWCYIMQGNCSLPASTEISSVICFSRQFSLEHPMLHFLTIRTRVRWSESQL